MKNNRMQESDWKEMKQMLEHYGGEWTEPDYQGAVSDYIPRTALLGNGDIGAVSYGNRERGEKIYLISKGDFWNCGDMRTNQLCGMNPGRVSPLALGGVTIREQKSAVLTEPDRESERGTVQGQEFGGGTALGADSGRGTKLGREFGAGHAGGSAERFLERQNISNGELITEMEVSGGKLVLKAWVSQTDNVIVAEITQKGMKSLNLEAAVWTKGDVAKFPAESGIKNGMAWAFRRSNNEAKENKKSWTSEAVIMMKLLGTIGAAYCRKEESVLQFTLNPEETVQAVIAVGGGGRTLDYRDQLMGEAPLKEVEAILDRYAMPGDITALKVGADQWWKDYWMKSCVHIGNELLQKYYYGSLYYMGAGARRGALAPGIFGIWTTTDGAMWNGDYHMNYNFIAPFYGMYSSNRQEHARPLKDPLLDYMEEGRRRALTDLDKVFPAYIRGGEGTADAGVVFPGREDLKEGIRDAVLYPVALGPWGSTAWQDENGGYLMQVYDAGFSALALTAYYRYTYDGEYLREVYPFLTACAGFYEKWCEKEELADGTYRYNVWSGAHEGTFDLNPPHTLGVILNILECLLLGAEKGHIFPSAEKIALWKDMTEHLASFPIRNYRYGEFDKPVIPLSEKGIVLWAEHASINLEFIIPGDRLGFDSEERLLEAARNSVELKELADRDIWNQVNITPKLYTQAIRCGFDPGYIIARFEEHLTAMHKNFTIEDGVHGIEKAGGIEFINNMLLFSDNGIIKVFPNWTGEDADFMTLREKGAFLVSSEMRDETVEYVQITSEAGTDLKLVNPWGGSRAVVTDSRGNSVAYTVGRTRNSKEETIEFATVKGECYSICQGLSLYGTMPC
jgi:hypothetical protein